MIPCLVNVKKGKYFISTSVKLILYLHKSKQIFQANEGVHFHVSRTFGPNC